MNLISSCEAVPELRVRSKARHVVFETGTTCNTSDQRSLWCLVQQRPICCKNGIHFRTPRLNHPLPGHPRRASYSVYFYVLQGGLLDSHKAIAFVRAATFCDCFALSRDDFNSLEQKARRVGCFCLLSLSYLRGVSLWFFVLRSPKGSSAWAVAKLSFGGATGIFPSQTALGGSGEHFPPKKGRKSRQYAPKKPNCLGNYYGSMHTVRGDAHTPT